MRVGDRVALVSTDDPYTSLKPGDEGVITRIAPTFGDQQVDVNWDSGSTLSMIPSSGDRIRVIKED